MTKIKTIVKQIWKTYQCEDEKLKNNIVGRIKTQAQITLAWKEIPPIKTKNAKNIETKQNTTPLWRNWKTPNPKNLQPSTPK